MSNQLFISDHCGHFVPFCTPFCPDLHMYQWPIYKCTNFHLSTPEKPLWVLRNSRGPIEEFCPTSGQSPNSAIQGCIIILSCRLEAAWTRYVGKRQSILKFLLEQPDPLTNRNYFHKILSALSINDLYQIWSRLSELPWRKYFQNFKILIKLANFLLDVM